MLPSCSHCPTAPSWTLSIGRAAAPLSRPGMRLGMSRNSAAATSPKIRIHWIHRRRRRSGRPMRRPGWGGGRRIGWRGWSRLRACAILTVAGPHLSCHWRRLPPPPACQVATCQAGQAVWGEGEPTEARNPKASLTPTLLQPTVLLILFALQSWIYWMFYKACTLWYQAPGSDSRSWAKDSFAVAFLHNSLTHSLTHWDPRRQFWPAAVSGNKWQQQRGKSKTIF